MNYIKDNTCKYFPFSLGLLLGLCFISFNIIGFSFTHLPGDYGDGRFNNYILEHAYKFFTGQTSSFWDAPFMYPEPKVISYSDNLLGTAPFYSFFRLVGFDRETAFQLWFVAMAVLSYTFTYFFLIDLFNNRHAAVLGAMVFAFSMALQSQITHAQTFPRFAIPLVFWMGIKFLDEFNPKFFFLVLLFVIYQIYCGIYLGLMIIIPVATMIIVGMIINREKVLLKLKNLKWNFAIVLSLIINFLLLLPLLIPYIIRANEVGMNHYRNIIASVPTFRSYFFSQQGSLIWDFLSKIGSKYPNWWDHQLFAGGFATLSLLAFSVIVIIKQVNKRALKGIELDKKLIILLFTGIVTFTLFTRVRGFSFYWLIFNLPGFASMRAVTRIINVELIFYAIAVAFISYFLLKKIKSITPVLFFILIIIFIVDNYYKVGAAYRIEKQDSQNRINLLVERMKGIPPGSIVSYEPDSVGNTYVVLQLDAMLAAQTLNLKSVNGYSATSPHEYTGFWFKMDSTARKTWLKKFNMETNQIFVIH